MVNHVYNNWWKYAAAADTVLRGYNFYSRNRKNLKRGALIAGAALIGKKVMSSRERGRSIVARARRSRSQVSAMETSRAPTTRSISVPARALARNATGRWTVSKRRRIMVKRAPKRGRFGGNVGKYGRKKSYRAKKLKVKKMKSLYRDCYYKGAVVHQEWGAITSNDYCVAFGHTTPLGALRQAFWMALVKKVVDRLGVQPIDPNASTFGVATNDTIVVNWRNQSGPRDAIVPTSILLSANQSLLSIANAVRTTMNAVGVAGNDELILESIVYNPVGDSDSTRIQINLQGAKVRFYYEGELKFQNRTSDGINNTEADDLVAQHVVGKYYSGYKNYAQLRSRSGATSNASAGFCGNFNGSLTPDSAFGGNDFREPLPQICIMGSSSGGMRMQPGEVRVSKISYKKETDLTKFTDQIAVRFDNGQASAEGRFNCYFGNYKFYMLEKEIETAVTPLTPVTMGCEWQYKVGVVIDVSRNTFMQRIVYNSDTISA